MGGKDHPRIRGEHAAGLSGVRLGFGSSPHTRGAPSSGPGPWCAGGIIPAYAGSTTTASTSNRSRRGSSPHTRGALRPPVRRAIRPVDHPRIRGEHHTAYTQALMFAGSSPHTRGARDVIESGQRRPRIIPAYAGSTGILAVARSAAADHPRIRGEHEEHPTASPSTEGSSPHTRGALTGRQPAGRTVGIIPAYAGSTAPVGEHGAGIQDHPRIRGEHGRAILPSRQETGSSPHTRGALIADVNSLQDKRIIPAYAGSTRVLGLLWPAVTDHPRIRGEHSNTIRHTATTTGSSPHTRGAPSSWTKRPTSVRIIPAYAGSTRHRSARAVFPRDHPRIRGEHVDAAFRRRWEEGSSPHTRGARSRRWRGRGQSPDHPRIRGEHFAVSTSMPQPSGSSPHTRGAPARRACL